MATGVILVTVTLTLAVTLFALLRLRAALDGVELNLRFLVTGLRTAARAVHRVPSTADTIADHVAGSEGGIGHLETLKRSGSAGQSQ